MIELLIALVLGLIAIAALLGAIGLVAVMWLELNDRLTNRRRGR